MGPKAKKSPKVRTLKIELLLLAHGGEPGQPSSVGAAPSRAARDGSSWTQCPHAEFRAPVNPDQKRVTSSLSSTSK